jgi:methylphosphotriester-DNA--protein-cysteine methyltransferase
MIHCMRVLLQFTGIEATMPMGMRSPVDPDEAWQRVLRRDREADFFYGVMTTGVFCRPNCASRRPLRENVRFFASQEGARRAGLRPCLKCKPESDAVAPLKKMRGASPA